MRRGSALSPSPSPTRGGEPDCAPDGILRRQKLLETTATQGVDVARERKSRRAGLADLANTVSRLREKFADLPEEEAIAEAERAALETRDEMRAERAASRQRGLTHDNQP